MGGVIPKARDVAQEMVYERFPATRPQKAAAEERNIVESTEEARQRAARIRSRRAGRPLLGPGGTRQSEDQIRTKLGAG